jgi:non-ribosomal peptide synthetase component E (peptide arylation enzyme)
LHPVFGEQVILVLEEEFNELQFQDIVIKLQNLDFKNEVPRQFRVINAIPLTENGKIDRKKLNESIDSQ